MPKRRKTMPMREGASNSASLGEPSQPERPCSDPSNQEQNRSERNFVQSSCITMEDVQTQVRKLGELANNVQSSMENMKNVCKELEQWISLLKPKGREELANNHSSHLGRANARSTGENDVRNLRLQIQTKVLDLVTGNKVVGEGGARISVALIDASTRDVVRSGPESSIKLDVVVLNGDFNKDDEDNWTQEEFENHVVKKRGQKGLLLKGDVQLTLKEGVGELGELIFMDNSSWNESKNFMIGLKVTSGYCGDTRIREAKTNAFRVKENRGISDEKHYPPAWDDEISRLDGIRKHGPRHVRLTDAGIQTVGDFLQQLFDDPLGLERVFEKTITKKPWNRLVSHARTCTNWETYVNPPNGMGKHAAVFNADCQQTGLINDIICSATGLSARETEPGDTIVKKAAFNNWDDVGEFNGETFSGSMPKYSSQVIEGQSGNLIPVQCHLAPRTCTTSVGPEALSANVGSPVEGYNGATAFPLPVQPQNTNCGAAMELPVDESAPLAASQPMSTCHLDGLFSLGDTGFTFRLLHFPNTISPNAMHSQGFDPSSHLDSEVNEVVRPSGPLYGPIPSFKCSSPLPRPEGNDVMEFPVKRCG